MYRYISSQINILFISYIYFIKSKVYKLSSLFKGFNTITHIYHKESFLLKLRVVLKIDAEQEI